MSATSYNLEVNLNTGYKRLAFSFKTQKYTPGFRKYLRENQGQSISNTGVVTDIPLRSGDVYNPASGMIVKTKNFYKQQVNKKEPTQTINDKIVQIRAPEQKKIVNKFVSNLNELYNSPAGTSAIFPTKYLTPENIDVFLSKLKTNPPIVATIYRPNDVPLIVTLSERFIKRIKALLTDTFEDLAGAGANPTFSDGQAEQFFSEGGGVMKLQVLEPSTLQQGAFFKYTLKHEIPNVEKYGLFTSVLSTNYTDSCFINALVASGDVDEHAINSIKLSIQTRELPMKKIKQIAEQFNLYIVVRGLSTKSNRINTYGSDTGKRVELGLIDGHYFLNDITDVTPYAIKNFESVKHLPNWNHMYRAGKYDSKRCMKSLALLKLLTTDQDVKKEFLQPIEMTMDLFATQHFGKFDKIGALSVQDCDHMPAVDHDERAGKQEKKEQYYEITSRVFFDFETDTTGKKHTPYLVCYKCDDGSGGRFDGSGCALSMLDDLHARFAGKALIGEKTVNRRVLMIAHNIGYDFTFLHKHLKKVETIEPTCSSLINATGTYYRSGSNVGLDVVVQCSYAKISKPLSAFGKMFKLEQAKEVLPYSVYTKENLANKHLHVDVCVADLSKKDGDTFIANCEKWGCIKDEYVNIVEYSARYCEMDCIVLCNGYNRFQSLIWEVCDSLNIERLNLDHYLTAASIADELVIRCGCFDDCVQLGGVVRAFIQRCLVGGRTMMANNTGSQHTNCNMADFDAVSLYPSAMARLNGFLKGAPKLINTTNYDELCKSSDGFYVRAIVKSVGKYRDFPLLSYKNDDGIRMFSNDMVGQEVYLDDVAMADAIKFQHIDFEIIDGYMFNEGYNTGISSTIRTMFAARLKAKKAGNPVQEVIKLILNSAYGKCALKEIVDEVKYVPVKEFNKHIIRHYNWVKEAVLTACGGYYRVKQVKAVSEHFNRVHLAIQVLSMSKRIMNEVMCLGEDIGKKIYYQDTDSMHIMTEDVAPIVMAYKEVYGRELEGSKMGQFHTDFDLDAPSGGSCENIHSKESIFLGKKCYIDTLSGTDPATGKEVNNYHIRMKGVPTKSVLGECVRRGCSPVELYRILASGETVEFDLLRDAQNKPCVRFQKTKTVTYKTVKEFKRAVTFTAIC